MDRVPEPELMADAAQALAYALADFDEPHSRCIALLRERMSALPSRGAALDLGCGPGDITLRFARAFPGWEIDAIDGAAAMLSLARVAARDAGLAARLRFVEAHLPAATLPRNHYDVVFSNSLLHHLADPAAFWEWLRDTFSGTPLFLMDLTRPETAEIAQQMVDRYAVGEPEVLRTDFFNSLCAAYTPAEITDQLHCAHLSGLSINIVSDRHLIVTGRIASA
jgi:2-polyprenyl-3-methyl-5-hydroxy-6-metoxy-1,4-benzoquinol methylase